MDKKPNNIPQTPGIYFFKKGRTILYIGKAKNLHDRVLSYFSKQNADPRKIDMVREATSVVWDELLSDTEALIYEAECIKKYRPKYNILMRDDKRYFYVGFSDDAFPRIFLTHQPTGSQKLKGKSQKLFIGPFTDGGSLRQTLKMLRRAFPYCTCKGIHKRRCQNAAIGKCLGFCCLDIHTNEARRALQRYKKNIHAMKHVLSGKGKRMMERMRKDMQTFSRGQQYEKAALIRDQLYALENIFSHKHLLKREEDVYANKGVLYLAQALGIKRAPKRIEAYDISNIQGKHAVGSMVVFTDGKPDKNEYRTFTIRLPARPNDVAMMREIITRRFRNAWPYPDVMIIDGGKPQLNTALKATKHISGAERIKISALAKREEELYLPNGKIIKLKEGPPPLLHLLQYIRNEAHRSAITHHRRKRSRHL